LKNYDTYDADENENNLNYYCLQAYQIRFQTWDVFDQEFKKLLMENKLTLLLNISRSSKHQLYSYFLFGSYFAVLSGSGWGSPAPKESGKENTTVVFSFLVLCKTLKPAFLNGESASACTYSCYRT
jgi:hypothetical protein